MPTHPSFNIFNIDHLASYFEAEFSFIRFSKDPVLSLTNDGFHFPSLRVLIKAPFSNPESILGYSRIWSVSQTRLYPRIERLTRLWNHVSLRETTALWVETSLERCAYQWWHPCMAPNLFLSMLGLLLCVCCGRNVRTWSRCVTAQITRLPNDEGSCGVRVARSVKWLNLYEVNLKVM